MKITKTFKNQLKITAELSEIGLTYYNINLLNSSRFFVLVNTPWRSCPELQEFIEFLKYRKESTIVSNFKSIYIKHLKEYLDKANFTEKDYENLLKLIYEIQIELTLEE